MAVHQAAHVLLALVLGRNQPKWQLVARLAAVTAATAVRRRGTTRRRQAARPPRCRTLRLTSGAEALHRLRHDDQELVPTNVACLVLVNLLNQLCHLFPWHVESQQRKRAPELVHIDGAAAVGVHKLEAFAEFHLLCLGDAWLDRLATLLQPFCNAGVQLRVAVHQVLVRVRRNLTRHPSLSRQGGRLLLRRADGNWCLMNVWYNKSPCVVCTEHALRRGGRY
mmetsp:Transcript_762/g.2056  ORF Transcript_762/g.2056 Transcript_762/m.2056 type:complete len:223 (+) Transcript_762:710-1378(+)